MKLYVPAVFLLAGCIPDADWGRPADPSATDAAQPGAAEAGAQVAGAEEPKRAAVGLEACQQFESYLSLKVVLEQDGSEAGPEWEQHGFRVGTTKQNRITVSWAIGYTAWDGQAETPERRAWWSCFLPASMTSDIPSPSYGAWSDFEAGFGVVKIMDEGVDGDRNKPPRREFATLIDLSTRRAFPRVLTRFSESTEADPPPGSCSVERDADLDKATKVFKIERWAKPTTVRCASLVEQHTTPAERAFGAWRFEPAAGDASDAAGAWY